MLASLITAVVTGLGGVLLNYLAQQRAQADHDTARDERGFIAGQADVTIAEKAIADAAKNARDTATGDLTTLR